MRGEGSKIATSASPWFSIELNRRSAPWPYHRGEPFRSIAALEALGALLGVVAFRGFYPRNLDTTVILPAIGDNRGNRYALSRLQTTKFPLCCVTMELSCQLERVGARLAMEWAPRELNEEADRLSNGDHTGFLESRRIHLNMDKIEWIVLNKMMALGTDFAGENLRQTAPATKARKTPKLRESEPW